MDNMLFTPALPISLVAFLIIAAFVLCLLTMRAHLFSSILRLLACASLGLLLLQPKLIQETSSPLPNVALIIKDESASQTLNNRTQQTDDASTELQERLKRLGAIDVREITRTGKDETRLDEAFYEGLADIPRNQLAGIFVITDGQSEHVPTNPAELGIAAPVHTILTGQRGETDRVLEIIQAPRFGIINERAEISFKVTDFGINNAPANITLKINGRTVTTRSVRVGNEIPLQVSLDRPGKALVELIASPVDGELTTRNNRAVIEISVIRDRLRVLLVSGEPHAGERVWRNLLKSDPAVDLIHFTILKPATKIRIAPQEELSLIRFPENELFFEKLDQFDVLIFDRYTYRGVMSPLHFENVSRYVQEGGAMLIASGPELIGNTSIANQRNLSYILPALPNGEINNEPFVPQLSSQGIRHPITDKLEDAQTWGRWLRSVGIFQRGGQVLMQRGDQTPLLIVDRVGQGRVGLLLSDHVWLWAKDFDGGGPHRELLRRLVHWLMKEPDLEEEAVHLSANANDETLVISRRTMDEEIEPVRIESPDGSITIISLNQNSDGKWSGKLDADEPGLYTATTQTNDGRTLFDVTALGLATPIEFQNVISTPDKMEPIATASGGGIYRAIDGLPTLRKVRPDRAATGRGRDTGWAGIYDKGAKRLETVSTKDLLPASVWLIIILGLLISAWLVESGYKRFFNKPLKN